ncbi:MAG: ferritin-like domain-containing protein [Rubrobacteraceae bacterium]|nr:ferritin-like domain-containing protein [Rubrobacteraceae bacterium]
MGPEFTLEEVDVDGAIRETAHDMTEALEKEGDTRLEFLKKAGIAGGAMMGGGALLSTLLPSAAMANAIGKGRPPSSFGPGDIGILNFALTLEYLERDFYNEAAKNDRRGSGFITDKSLKNFLMAVVPDERKHVEFLEVALGSSAVKNPQFQYGKATSNEKLFTALSYGLENTGVGAYSGQAFNITDPNNLAVALSIVTIEARHSGLIGEILKNQKGVAPYGAFDRALSADEVLKAVAKTGLKSKRSIPSF